MDTLQDAILFRGCPHLDTESEVKPCQNQEGCTKLSVFDWLRDIPHGISEEDLVEVRFKNTRKAYYRNINVLNLKPGDMIAVEASPGHDIGMVSLIGPLVLNQLRKYRINPEEYEFRKVYRKAKQADIEKWKEAMALEHHTMLRARKITQMLKLEMKVGDVEFQGDKTKAIFYYIADDRVDFRELIKYMAEEFKIRVEMRQIGARQEAGRIGGIGSCGRELCCSTWLTSFVTVTTTVARNQELSFNPQKLAGQCGKLKCCLNYEVDAYLDAQKDFPSAEIVLETREGKAYHQKTDIFKRMMWYSFDSSAAMNLIPITVERVLEIVRLNKQGIIVERLTDVDLSKIVEDVGYMNAAGQESLTRFDDKKRTQRRPQAPVKPQIQVAPEDRPKIKVIKKS
ncbi:MAG: regulatory iron-sulfur-containing complex subunit RicT [Bacteroidia bacterium]|nr:regulatory iron-sulfur-containing complex subunit RicT [Bacteroidia bacterium]